MTGDVLFVLLAVVVVVVLLVVVVVVWVVELDVGGVSVVVSCVVGFFTESDSDDCSTVCIGLSADAKLLMNSWMSKSPVSNGASSRLWRNTVGSN